MTATFHSAVAYGDKTASVAMGRWVFATVLFRSYPSVGTRTIRPWLQHEHPGSYNTRSAEKVSS